MNDLEIKNATIVDGLGKESYEGNIYVKNGKIVAITHKESLDSNNIFTKENYSDKQLNEYIDNSEGNHMSYLSSPIS